MKQSYTDEGGVKTRVKERLKEYGAWWFMPHMTGMGRPGIPDFIGCYQGRLFAIETKYGKGRRTKRQELEAEKLKTAGALYLLVNEKNVEDWQL